MILGLGNDLCDIRRIEQALERFPERFLERLFTPRERGDINARTGARRSAAAAMRFAAKEACAKALGTGFSQGVAYRDIELRPLATGQPTLVLTGGALRRLKALTPSSMVARIDVSLSDEASLAQAVVVLSAVSTQQC